VGRWKANEVQQEQIARHSQTGIQQVSGVDPFVNLPETDATDQSPVQQTHYQEMQPAPDLFEK
jgi:hypothetical protein